MADFIPDRDTDFQTWLTNFLKVASEKPDTLGLTQSELSELSSRATAFSESVNQVEAARSAFNGALETKKTSRTGAEEMARSLVRKVQNHEATTDSQRAALRLTVKDSNPTPGNPIAPTGLVVTGDATGTHRLKWERAGNVPGTQFVVEAKIGSGGPWSLVDVVTASRFSHAGQKPGVAIVYRIRARRRGVTSDPSNEAALYL